MRWMEAEAKEVAVEWHPEVGVVEAVDLMRTGRHFAMNRAALQVLRDREQGLSH